MINIGAIISGPALFAMTGIIVPIVITRTVMLTWIIRTMVNIGTVCSSPTSIARATYYIVVRMTGTSAMTCVAMTFCFCLAC